MQTQAVREYIEQNFEFADFDAGLAFVQVVADIARQQNHHPEVRLDWGRVRLRWTTHDAACRISARDRQCAQLCQAAYADGKHRHG